MHHEHPPLYKLMTSATGKIVLANRTLRWTTPPTFNDPFDVQTELRLSQGETEGVKEAALDMLWESIYENGPLEPLSPLGGLILRIRGSFPPQTREAFRDDFGPGIDQILAGMLPNNGAQAALHEFMSRVKILCLTDRIDSVPMWSHYADQHSGVALRFCTPAGFDSPWVMAKPIRYVDAPPTLVDREFLPAFLAGRYLPDKRKLFEALTYTKGSEWAYESEWRISSGDGRNPKAPFEDLPFFAQEVDAIIFGCRMPEEDRLQFTAITEAHFPHAELMVAAPCSDRYRMTLEPLNPKK